MSLTVTFSLEWRMLYQVLSSSICWGFSSEKAFPGDSDSKKCACSVGDPGSIPGFDRSPGEGNGNPLQHSCLENPMDGGAWQATVYGVAKSRTWLSNFISFFFSSVKELKDNLMCSLRQRQSPVPRLHYILLVAPPLSLHPLPSLIINYLNLLIGTQGRSGRLETVPYKQETGDTERLLYPGAPQCPAWFHLQYIVINFYRLLLYYFQQSGRTCQSVLHSSTVPSIQFFPVPHVLFCLWEYWHILSR